MSYTPMYINRQLGIVNNSAFPQRAKDDVLFRLASHLDIKLDPDNYSDSEKQIVIAKAQKYLA